MGTVYLGERDDGQFEQRVAIKLIRGGLGADLLVQRFLKERSILAGLEHKHIARLIDGGVTTEGMPWFAMEFVEGIPINRYSAERGLPLNEKLQLFRDVCVAVEYAHSMRVIHRDLKPANVLVMSDGTVKLLDFGIAKLLDTGGIPSDAEITRTTAVMLTPEYAAPERLRGEPGTVASDIYALGVLLYELLVGERPFNLRGHSAAEAERIACETEPVPPSVALRRLHREWRRLRDDLDTIVLKTLQKDPVRRYASVAALLDDLHRYGDGRPVLARRDTIVYRLRRYAGRKRSAFIAATGIIALAIGIGGMYSAQTGAGSTLLGKGILKEREPLIVADFHVAASDASLGSMLTDALRAHLAQSPVISIVPEDQIRSARTTMARPLRTRLDAAFAREMAQREGVRAVVAGELVGERDGYMVKLRLIAASTGEELASFQKKVSNPETDLLPAIERLGHALRAKIGESLRDVRADPIPDPVTTSSLEALRLYTEARRTAEGDISKRVALFRDAIARDSMFAMAYVGLGGAVSRHSAAARDSALTKAYQLRDRLRGREKVHVSAWYLMNTAHDSKAAIALYETHLVSDSTDPRAITNLAILLGASRHFARAESLLRNGERVLGGLSNENIAYLQLAQGNFAGADSTLRRMVQRRSDTPAGLRVSLFTALARLEYDSAAARATQWRSVMWSPGSQLYPTEFLVRIARTRGRLAEARRLTEELNPLRASIGVALRPRRIPLDAAAEEIWLRARPKRALARLDAAFIAHPMSLPGSADDRAEFLEAASLYAAAGRIERARSILNTITRTADPAALAATIPQRGIALGEIALAEGRTVEALAAFRHGDMADNSWVNGPCVVCILPRLARAADRAGWADSSRIFWERHVVTPSVGREVADQWFLAMAYRRLSELYGAEGDRVKAAEYDQRLATLWQGADPELQPQVATARRRMGRAPR